jgi:hypothetical protein
MFYSVILYLCHLGTIFCDVFSLDVCLICRLHVFIHIYNQSNYVSTGINHGFYMLYLILHIYSVTLLHYSVLAYLHYIDMFYNSHVL